MKKKRLLPQMLFIKFDDTSVIFPLKFFFQTPRFLAKHVLHTNRIQMRYELFLRTYKNKTSLISYHNAFEPKNERRYKWNLKEKSYQMLKLQFQRNHERE